jgi:hypothetical protein
VAKPNYHHARRQKELARKSRQQEKQQKRAATKGDPELAPATGVDSTADTVGALQPNIDRVME